MSIRYGDALSIHLVPKLYFGTRLRSQLHCGNLRTMRSRYKVQEPDHAHFITATVVEWLPIFTSSACCDVLVQSFEYCRRNKGLRIHAWVIMDHHFHAVVSGPELGETLRDLKRFTSRLLLGQIRAEKREWLLNQLSFFCAANKTNSVHQVWQEGIHPQAIYSDTTMMQKIDYLHNNPVKRGWVDAPEDWRYSSAHEWQKGGVPVMRCDPWR